MLHIIDNNIVCVRRASAIAPQSFRAHRTQCVHIYAYAMHAVWMSASRVHFLPQLAMASALLKQSAIRPIVRREPENNIGRRFGGEFLKNCMRKICMTFNSIRMQFPKCTTEIPFKWLYNIAPMVANGRQWRTTAGSVFILLKLINLPQSLAFHMHFFFFCFAFLGFVCFLFHRIFVLRRKHVLRARTYTIA